MIIQRIMGAKAGSLAAFHQIAQTQSDKYQHKQSKYKRYQDQQLHNGLQYKAN